MKKGLYIVAAVVFAIAAAYLGNLALYAVLLSMTPGVDVEVAQFRFNLFGGAFLVLLVAAGFFGRKFYVLYRRNNQAQE